MKMVTGKYPMKIIGKKTAVKYGNEFETETEMPLFLLFLGFPTFE